MLVGVGIHLRLGGGDFGGADSLPILTQDVLAGVGNHLWLGGALTIHPPTKRPRDTSTQAQLTHGLPPGCTNKQFLVAGDRQGR
jgi:hypothetical protein